MNIETFKQRREALREAQPQYRNLCKQCLQPGFSCYCHHIQKLDPKIKFMILIHPMEMRRRIATGRMSHLCLENSELIQGLDYSNDAKVNEVLSDPQYQPAVLYPGPLSKNITKLSIEEKSSLFDSKKTPVIFVIDGTWATARKTMRLSENIRHLPRLCFTPQQESQFRVRKQPKAECVSTIEAIHHLIDLLGDRPGFSVANKEHQRLLYVFNKMVERQIEFVPATYSYRRRDKVSARLRDLQLKRL